MPAYMMHMIFIWHRGCHFDFVTLPPYQLNRPCVTYWRLLQPQPKLNYACNSKHQIWSVRQRSATWINPYWPAHNLRPASAILFLPSSSPLLTSVRGSWFSFLQSLFLLLSSSLLQSLPPFLTLVHIFLSSSFSILQYHFSFPPCPHAQPYEPPLIASLEVSETVGYIALRSGTVSLIQVAWTVSTLRSVSVCTLRKGHVPEIHSSCIHMRFGALSALDRVTCAR